ncbi:hypothetical protein [Butyrivibrio sp. AE3004]|uniref:hypothetical protein n=1 Tax=Butyrivibrio sp. AE3004 TaxID=1506994 RepID=UPI000494860D|nr:hypothetical protein [Butyrivibrio sp. AE3004]
MLQIYVELTDDKKVSGIIEKFASTRILNIMQFHLEMNMYDTLDSVLGISPKDAEFYKYIMEDISQENVSEEDANSHLFRLSSFCSR